jgi:uncharacterized protein (TIGR00730 family)
VAAICVYCGSVEGLAPQYLQLATEVGTAMAQRGHALVWGGATVSMMGAVAAAARAGGAATYGVIPQALVSLEIADHAATELAVVESMRERKARMEARADAFLALPGGLGTLEELFEIWTARYLQLHRKPVVLLNAFDYYTPLLAAVDGLSGHGFIRPGSIAALTVVTTVADAMDQLELAADRTSPIAARGSGDG